MRQRNSRSSGLISNIDASALAVVMFVLVFAFIFLTATPHYGVSADLPKVWYPIPCEALTKKML
jgi:biopolymer transport protein ExbD